MGSSHPERVSGSRGPSGLRVLADYAYFCIATGRAIALYNQKEGGKSGQLRAMHRLIAGIRLLADTDSATENNCPATRRDEGENAG